ncbi:hypothetical protein TNCV_2946451 [Trichonephila clavipes]|nr:hypothetical protein TNCV_2946451 [Trichonephila clavipes]
MRPAVRRLSIAAVEDRTIFSDVQASVLKTERGEEDQISSSINHVKNLTSLTSSKYNELKGLDTLSECTKTALVKKSSMPNQMAHEERAGQILDGLMAYKKIS